MASTTQRFPYPKRAVDRPARTAEPVTLAQSVGVAGKAYNPITGLGFGKTAVDRRPVDAIGYSDRPAATPPQLCQPAGARGRKGPEHMTATVGVWPDQEESPADEVAASSPRAATGDRTLSARPPYSRSAARRKQHGLEFRLLQEEARREHAERLVLGLTVSAFAGGGGPPTPRNARTSQGPRAARANGGWMEHA